jgi:uncharacterized protein (UPF0332 family)
MLANDWPDEAARAAYLAGFHAAQALILARTGRVTKSHSGLRNTFARLTRNDPAVDRRFTRFLAQGYAFKEIADYVVQPEAVVTVKEAQEMLDTAALMVNRIADVLA